MITILKESDIDFITRSYMYNDNITYVLRLIKVFNQESERYCLFSLDYMSDKDKNYSLISYKDKRCTCSCCNRSIEGAMLFLLDDDLTTICFDCLQRKHFSFSPDVNISFIAKLLAKHNHVDMLTKIFSNCDTEHSYYGYRVRSVSKSEEMFYYLDTQDRYSLHSIDKNKPFDVTFNNARLLYLYNYYLLMKLLKRVSDEEICYKVLSKNFSQEELQDVMLTLAKSNQSKEIEIAVQSGFSTMTNLAKPTSDSGQYPKGVLRKPATEARSAEGSSKSTQLNSEQFYKIQKSQKQLKEITSIKSKTDNVLEVGKTYKNAKVKLLHVLKDHKGFFKGNYKFLYVIYYGSHALLWNTNKIVDDGNYVCSFIVQRSAHSKGYIFVNNCRLKKIEKES